jgi:diamine N-acetyltransferase
LKVSLREVVKDDHEIILKWRNDPDVMKGIYSQRNGHRISSIEHMEWIRSRNQDFKLYMILAGDDICQRVGVIHLSQLDHWEPETGIYIGEKSFWRKGIAQASLKQIFEIIRSQGYQYTRATILNNNQSSINLYKRLGFERIGEARPDESLYRLKL